MKECLLCHSCFGDHMMNCDRDGAKLVDTLPGTPLLDNRYRLERQLGAGSMYIIFEGIMISSKQAVMVKILLPELIKADPSLTERFMQQMGIAAGLDHSNIARVLDYGEANGLVYLVSEYFNGYSLTEMLSLQGMLSVDQALSIVMQICEGVSIAHRRNIQHRDLKLSNILVANLTDQQEVVKIYDFGFARLKTEDLLSVVTKKRGEQLLGLPLYTAPEQFDSIAIDGRADVYSIGAILYHLLAGQPPFNGKTYATLKEQHLTGQPVPLREYCPEVPKVLEDLVMKSLNKKMAQRPITVMTMAVQMAALLAEEKESVLDMMSVYEPSPPSPPLRVKGSESEPYYPYSSASALPPLDQSQLDLLSEGELNEEDPLAELLAEQEQDPLLEQTEKSSPIDEESEAINEERGAIYEDRGAFTDPNLSELKILAQSLFDDEFLNTPTEKHERIKRNPTSPLPVEATRPPKRRTRRHASMSLEGLSPEALNQIETYNQIEDINSSNNLPASSDPLAGFEEIPDLSTRPERPLSREFIESSVNFRSSSSNSLLEQSSDSISIPVIESPQSDPLPPIVRSESLSSDAMAQSQWLPEPEPAIEPIPDTRPVSMVNLPENLNLPAVIDLSPPSVIYLFANQFVPSLQPGQRRRRLHNGFICERERIAALLLTAALFSLRSRGAVNIVTGATESRKWQRAMRPQRNEGFVVEALNLDVEPLDMLESKILGALKQDSPIRFYNIFLFIAQTSVATVDGEAICEIVADAIADELSVRKLLRTSRRTDQLVAGESAIQYELNATLQPYYPQARYINNWLLSLQQEPTTMIAGRPIQPLTHILKYYTDLFRHNSKELENEE